MKKSTFIALWNSFTKQWYSGSFTFENDTRHFQDVCQINNGAVNALFSKYNKIKKVIKACYFKNNISHDCHLNRYKRAAALIGAVILVNPLKYVNDINIEKLYLKQRFAFAFGIHSILQDYPYEKVLENLKDGGSVFDFESLNQNKEDDSFLLSIYKDLFFAEVFQNYNVLTMANLLGVLVQRSSILSSIEPYPHTECP